jgi:hypothetical protein
MTKTFASSTVQLGTVDLLDGSADPAAGAGVAAPTGSLYLRTTGAAYVKTGAGNTAWTQAAAGGISTLTGDVTATGNGSVAATVQGIGGSSTTTRLCVVGGAYATLQAAVDACADGDSVLVGPKISGDWGDVVLPVGKRLSIVGLAGARNTTVKVKSITFAVNSGLNINANEIFVANLFITGDFSSYTNKWGVSFSGSNLGRLRLQGCFIFNSGTGASSNVINNNAASSSGTSSSLYLDDCLVQSSSTAGSVILLDHQSGYTVVRKCQIETGQYAVKMQAGNCVILYSQIDNSAAREACRVEVATPGTFPLLQLSYSTVSNSTTNGSGVNLVSAGASLAVSCAAFSVATGTGYVVNGVASTFYLYGNGMSYANNASVAYNVKIKNTITALAVTTTLTPSA